MAVKVRIPTPLRGLTLNQDIVPAEGPTLGAAINELEASFPGLKDRICDDQGEIRRFVNVYVNGEDVRFLDGLGTALKANDEISIVPAVAGGSLGPH
jgi:molybdopterin synthase sulfur carrier subunit